MLEEFLNLFQPLISQSVWADNQVDSALAIRTHLFPRFVDDNSKALDGFSETHIVTESTVESVFSELGHPLYSLFLVFSELGIWLDHKLIIFCLDI